MKPADVVTHPSSPLSGGTTNDSLASDLRASLYANRIGLYAGETWGEFKSAMAGLGITDDMRLASIEYGVRKTPVTGRIVVDATEDGLEIRESRV